MKGKTAEFEVTCNIPIPHAKAIEARVQAPGVYFQEYVHALDFQKKQVKRVYEDGTVACYEKYAFHKQHVAGNSINYISAHETPIADEVPSFRFTIKKRLTFPSICAHPAGKMELTYGYRGLSSLGIEDAKKYLHMENLTTKTRMKDYFAYLSFEATQKLTKQEIMTILKLIDDIYLIPRVQIITAMATAKSKYMPFVTIHELMRNRVRELDVEGARTVVFPAKRQGGCLWWAEKLDGVLAYLIISADGTFSMLSKLEYRFALTGTECTTPSELWDHWGEIENKLHRLSVMVFEGEYYDHKFYAFSGFRPTHPPAKTPWLAATSCESLIEEAQLLVNGIEIIHKKYVAYPLPPEHMAGCTTDGHIYVVANQDTVYTRAATYKVKPKATSTLDCAIINGEVYIAWRNTPQLIPCRWPLLTWNPYDLSFKGRTAEDELLMQGAQYAIYEACIHDNQTLSLLKRRDDKVLPNGTDTYAAVFGNYVLPEWSIMIQDEEDVGFSGTPSKNPNRYAVTNACGDAISRLCSDEPKSLLDLGGGKLGYLNYLVKLRFTKYTNVDSCIMELCGGFSRLASHPNGQPLYNVYEMVHSPMEDSSVATVLTKMGRVGYDVVISVFAFHFACSSQPALEQCVATIKATTKVGAHVLVIVWDGDMIQHELEQSQDGQMDYGINSYRLCETPNMVICTPSFGIKSFEEPLYHRKEVADKFAQYGFAETSWSSLVPYLDPEKKNSERIAMAERIAVHIFQHC